MKTTSLGFKILISGLIIILFLGIGYIFTTTKSIIGGEKRAINTNTVDLLEDDMKAYLENSKRNKDPDFMAAKQSLDSNNIKESVALWEKVVKNGEKPVMNEEGSGSTNTGVSVGNLKPQALSKIVLAQTYLKYGNYYYKEKESADKAIKLLTENSDDDYGAHGMYFVGYAYEITRQYDKALEWYNKGLKVSSNTDKLNAIFDNQIGHVYDLMGDPKKAFDYYTEAYKLDNTNLHSAGNLGRSLVRLGKIKESIPYFTYALTTKDMLFRAELYYTLSSLELELGDFKPDIDKSISFARASIKSFPDYPMGYSALARGLYMKNDRKYDKEIEESLLKSIKLNPNGSYIYELAALHDYDLGNYDRSLQMIQTAISLLSKDVIIMGDERNIMSANLSTESLFLSVYSKLSDKTKMITFVKEFYKTPTGKHVIDLQIKRNNYGILSSIKDENGFKEIFNESNE